MSDRPRCEIDITKYGHTFHFIVTDEGVVQYQIDGGEFFTAINLDEGKVWFDGKVEISIEGDIAEISSLNLSDRDYQTLKDAQDMAIAQDMAMQHSNEDSAEDASEQEKTEQDDEAMPAPVDTPLVDIDGYALMRQVDNWKKKMYTYKNKKGVKNKYCLHTLTIGVNKYCFIEREIPGMGVVINPDYKIQDDMPNVGGLLKRHGELMFWDYYFEGEGWKKIRPLSYNELICVSMIKTYGVYAGASEEKGKI